LVCLVKLKFHGTDTDTDTDTDFLARKSACPALAEVAPQEANCCGARGPFSMHDRASLSRITKRRSWFSSPDLSADFCPTCELFLARMSVGDARVYTCTCIVHDKLSCTRLQNYTIGTSLKSVSVSVPWNLSSLRRIVSDLFFCAVYKYSYTYLLITLSFQHKRTVSVSFSKLVGKLYRKT